MAPASAGVSGAVLSVGATVRPACIVRLAGDDGDVRPDSHCSSGAVLTIATERETLVPEGIVELDSGRRSDPVIRVTLSY